MKIEVKLPADPQQFGSPQEHPQDQTILQSPRNFPNPSFSKSNFLSHPIIVTSNQSQPNGAIQPKTSTKQIQPSPLPQNPTLFKQPSTPIFTPQFHPTPFAPQQSPFVGHPASDINLQTGAFTLSTAG